MNRYMSRKFITTLLCLAAAHHALLSLLISGEQYKVIVISILGLYGTANVVQKFFSNKETQP